MFLFGWSCIFCFIFADKEILGFISICTGIININEVIMAAINFLTIITCTFVIISMGICIPIDNLIRFMIMVMILGLIVINLRIINIIIVAVVIVIIVVVGCMCIKQRGVMDVLFLLYIEKGCLFLSLCVDVQELVVSTVGIVVIVRVMRLLFVILLLLLLVLLLSIIISRIIIIIVIIIIMVIIISTDMLTADVDITAGVHAVASVMLFIWLCLWMWL